MSQELFYTSAPVGLKPGSKGFCTIAMTAGMSGVLAQRLEMLSSYRELFAPGDPRVQLNPPAYSYLRLSVGAQSYGLLSRVCFAGVDYSQRANMFAHHIVLDSSEQSAGGPAWLMSQPGVMETQWSGSPRLLPIGRALPRGDDPPRICSAWRAAAGDAGWAGVLAEAAGDSTKVSYVIYSLGTETLPLIREAMAILPPRQRWPLTFCSYFTELPPDCTCAWRFCVAGTAAAKEARRYASSGVIIDLTANAESLSDSPMVHVARTGEISPEIASISTPAPAPLVAHTPSGIIPRQAPALRQLARARSASDQSWMPPSDATVVESDADRTGHRDMTSSGSRMAFWLVALIWPMLVIPGIITWHLMAESQAKRALSDRNEYLEQQNANLLGQNGRLLSTTRKYDDIIAKSAQDLVVTKSDLATAKEQEQKLSATTRDTQQQLEQKQNEINSLQKEKKEVSDKLALATTRASMPPNMTAPSSQPTTAPAALLTSIDDRRGTADPPVSGTNFGPSHALANLVESDGQQKVLWDGEIVIAEPRIELAAPIGGQFSYTPKGTKIKILDQNQNTFAWLEMEDGQLKFVPNGGLDTTSKEFKNWLRLAYVRVFDGKTIITQVRFAPLIRKSVASVDVDLDLPEYIKVAKIALKSEAYQNSGGWEINNEGDVINCRYKDNIISLRFDNGRLVEEASTQPTNAPPPPKLPRLVVELLYRYDDYPPLTLCNLTIDAHK